MEFGLSEEQVLLQDTLARLLQDQCALDQVRITVGAGSAQDERLWQSLVAMGLTGLMVPEQYGGLGMTLLDAALVQEQLGRHVAPVAFMASAVMATQILLGAASEAQKQDWMPRIADGSLQVAVAISELSGRRDGAGLSVVDGKLDGHALFVLGAPAADLILVTTTTGEVYAVEADSEGLERINLQTIDQTQCLAEIVMQQVVGQPLLAATAETVQRAQDAGRVMLAADTLGSAQRMLEKAVEYAGERKQFNRVIGSFQAVKHLCAEMAADLEPCRSLVWYAAYAFDAIPAESRLVACHAKAHLAEVGRFVARTATEVHGGMGFTDLMGLHFWFKRIGVNRQLLGSPERAREDAARVQGWIQ